MKKIVILFIFILFFPKNIFCQTYTFSVLSEKVNVETSKGSELRTIANYQGPYSFVFETPSNQKTKRLFTILNPGQRNGPGIPFYGLIEDKGYIEKNGLLMKKSLYANTASGEYEMVLISEDYSLIVIFKKDNTVSEYYR
jgi:hypothetical protein